MKGTFDTTEMISSFIGPLKSLSDVMQDNGVVLNVNAQEKTINVYALNSSLGTLVYLKYVGLFDNFEFAKADEKIGVLRLGDFVKYFSVLDEAGASIEFVDTVFSINHNSGKMSFKTADPDMIDQAPKSFKGTTWYNETAVNQSFGKLNKAMNVLANEDCLFVKGTTDNKIEFTVRSSSVDINSFKIQVDTPVSADFESLYRKDVIQMVFRTPCDSISVSFAERLARFDCKSKNYELTYYVAKKAQSK